MWLLSSTIDDSWTKTSAMASDAFSIELGPSLPTWALICMVALFSSMDFWAAFNTFRTRSPSLPSVKGRFPVTIQLKKCWHSSRRGSSWGIFGRSGSPLSGTGRLFSQRILWGYKNSLSSQGLVSLNTAIFLSPTTTSFCSLNGCSHETNTWAWRPEVKVKWVVVTSAIFLCR